VFVESSQLNFEADLKEGFDNVNTCYMIKNSALGLSICNGNTFSVLLPIKTVSDSGELNILFVYQIVYWVFKDNSEGQFKLLF
jgi:hypothetical protein